MRVLIVDDEAGIRFLLRTAFELAGHEVTEAIHGAQALELIRTFEPAVVVTDFMMPVMTGGELIDALRDNPETAELPIILVTASISPAAHAKVDAAFRKPVDPELIVRTAEELVRG